MYIFCTLGILYQCCLTQGSLIHTHTNPKKKIIQTEPPANNIERTQIIDYFCSHFKYKKKYF